MKRFVPLAMLGGFLAAAPAMAQVSVYGAGGPAFPTGDDMDLLNVGSGLQLVGGIELDLNERISIFGEGQWGTHDLDGNGDASVKPSALMAGLLVGLSGSEDVPVSPYVFGGVGIQTLSADDNDGDPSDSTLGYQAGLGIGFDLIGLNSFLEGRYQAASFDADSEFEEFDFSMFSILFGFSFDLGGDD